MAPKCVALEKIYLMYVKLESVKVANILL